MIGYHAHIACVANRKLEIRSYIGIVSEVQRIGNHMRSWEITHEVSYCDERLRLRGGSIRIRLKG